MESIRHFLFQLSSSFSLKDIIVISLLSLLMGEFIYFTFRISHRVVPDKFFTCSMLLYPFLCSTVIYSVNSFSSVLFLLIILIAIILFNRKLTIMYKDSQLFLIWSVACGVLNADKKFIVSAILCVVAFAIFWVVKIMIDDMSKLLVIEGDSMRELEVQATVFKLFKKKAKLVSKVNENDNFTLIYRVSAKSLEEYRKHRVNIIEEISSNGGVTNVTIKHEENINEK